jgi:2-polyprenyl-3-methyl-5-hydroxy-6-metoxy-1,4-benzoquinol methylase
MRYATEKFDPPTQELATVVSCAERIHPDAEQMAEWFQDYVQSQKNRIAFDLKVVDEECEKGAAIIEFGAVPLLLTASLARLGYSVTGIDIAPDRFSDSIRNIGLKVIKCDIETEALPFHDSQFDVVLFNELFEHLRINPILRCGRSTGFSSPETTVLVDTEFAIARWTCQFPLEESMLFMRGRSLR